MTMRSDLSFSLLARETGKVRNRIVSAPGSDTQKGLCKPALPVSLIGRKSGLTSRGAVRRLLAALGRVST